MSDDDPFGEDFGSLEKFLEGMKPGEHRPLSGIQRYRKGGDADQWNVAGEVKYIPGAWQLQVGVTKWEGVAAVSGFHEFDFPSKYRSVPLVIACNTYTWPLFQQVTCQANAANDSTCEIWWWSTASLTEVWFSWLALGSVGP